VGSLLVAIMTGLCAKVPRVSTLAIKGPPGFAAKYDVVRQISLVGRRGLAADRSGAVSLVQRSPAGSNATAAGLAGHRQFVRPNDI